MSNTTCTPLALCFRLHTNFQHYFLSFLLVPSPLNFIRSRFYTALTETKITITWQNSVQMTIPHFIKTVQFCRWNVHDFTPHYAFPLSSYTTAYNKSVIFGVRYLAGCQMNLLPPSSVWTCHRSLQIWNVNIIVTYKNIKQCSISFLVKDNKKHWDMQNSKLEWIKCFKEVTKKFNIEGNSWWPYTTQNNKSPYTDNKLQ